MTKSKLLTAPNTERKKAGHGVKGWLKRLLRKRRTFLFAMQTIKLVVELMQALRDLFGGP